MELIAEHLTSTIDNTINAFSMKKKSANGSRNIATVGFEENKALSMQNILLS